MHVLYKSETFTFINEQIDADAFRCINKLKVVYLISVKINLYVKWTSLSRTL